MKNVNFNPISYGIKDKLSGRPVVILLSFAVFILLSLIYFTGINPFLLIERINSNMKMPQIVHKLVNTTKKPGDKTFGVSVDVDRRDDEQKKDEPVQLAKVVGDETAHHDILNKERDGIEPEPKKGVIDENIEGHAKGIEAKKEIIIETTPVRKTESEVGQKEQKKQPEILMSEKEARPSTVKSQEETQEGRPEVIQIAQKEKTVNTGQKDVPKDKVPEAKVSQREDEGAQSTDKYFIKVCSCVLKENSDSVFNQLLKIGYSPLKKNKKKPIMMYNIYSKIVDSKFEAEDLFKKLQDEKFDTVLIALEDGRFTMRIASCLYKASAEAVIHKLTDLGYGSRLVQELTKTTMNIVILNNFKDKSEAQKTLDKLIQKGFDSAFLTRVL